MYSSETHVTSAAACFSTVRINLPACTILLPAEKYKRKNQITNKNISVSKELKFVFSLAFELSAQAKLM